jgi:hypothetical protein
VQPIAFLVYRIGQYSAQDDDLRALQVEMFFHEVLECSLDPKVRRAV